eukprot:scaffold32381_cov107-Isochrysis_galbana.AAC.4
MGWGRRVGVVAAEAERPRPPLPSPHPHHPTPPLPVVSQQASPSPSPPTRYPQGFSDAWATATVISAGKDGCFVEYSKFVDANGKNLRERVRGTEIEHGIKQSGVANKAVSQIKRDRVWVPRPSEVKDGSGCGAQPWEGEGGGWV